MAIEGDPDMLARVLVAGAQVAKDNDKVKRHLKAAYRKKLTGARSGRVYTTYFFTNERRQAVPVGNRPPHQASAPGEPPARDTGSLLKSMTFTSRRSSDSTAEITVSCHSSYGRYLEMGTSKMRPRPFMRSTLREEQEAIRAIWAKGITDRERLAAGGS